MSDTDNENLRRLVSKLFGDEKAPQIHDDIRWAEQIVRHYPPPQPDEHLIARIKDRVAVGSRAWGPATHTIHYRVPAAAAIIFLAAALLMTRLLPRARRPAPPVYYGSLIPTAVWESDDVMTDDPDLLVFRTEIEQIEQQLRVIESGEEPPNGYNAYERLEMEFEEIDSDFWKG